MLKEGMRLFRQMGVGKSSVAGAVQLTMLNSGLLTAQHLNLVVELSAALQKASSIAKDACRCLHIEVLERCTDAWTRRVLCAVDHHVKVDEVGD